jgi:hypothetical protein
MMVSNGNKHFYFLKIKKNWSIFNLTILQCFHRLVHYLHNWRILFPFLVRLWSGLRVFNTTFKLPYMYIGMIVFINGGNWIIQRKSMTFHKPIHWQNVFNIKFYQVHILFLTDRTWTLKHFNVIQTERHLTIAPALSTCIFKINLTLYFTGKLPVYLLF